MHGDRRTSRRDVVAHREGLSAREAAFCEQSNLLALSRIAPGGLLGQRPLAGFLIVARRMAVLL
jgi:hypothetical protein